VAAGVRHRIDREVPSNDVLAERVRATMGRCVSHPHAIHVEARDGQVVLSGPILGDEVQPLVRAVRAVPGVHGVEDRLERHTRAENIPALQGGVRPPGEPAEGRQRRWTPALQLATGVAVGVGLLAAGTQWARAQGRGKRDDAPADAARFGAAHEIYGRTESYRDSAHAIGEEG
jgi:hypothetical protein